MAEEGERRSLRTKSIPGTEAKWLLLLNADKAWAHISVFLCVQGVGLISITQDFLAAGLSGALTSQWAGRRVSPGCRLSVVVNQVENTTALQGCQPLGSSLQDWSRES